MRALLHLLSLSLASAALLVTSCRSVEPDSSLGRHLDSETWSRALKQNLSTPDERDLEAVFLALTPIAAMFDSDLSEDAQRGYVTDGNSISGDVVSVALGTSTVVLGAARWASDGDSRTFEVATESLVATALTTDVLKLVTQRPRPDDPSSSDSFPSGHTSFAFAGATFLARLIHDEQDSHVGYIFYLPAFYVAIDRVEVQRHYASDVAFGAFLGTFLTNWVYDAHYGERGGEGALFQERVHFQLGPVVSDQGVGLGLSVSF